MDAEEESLSFLRLIDEENEAGVSADGISDFSGDVSNSWGLVRGLESDYAFDEISEGASAAGINSASVTVGESTVLSENNYKNALRDAVTSTSSLATPLKQPWETGPMKFLFSDALSLQPDLTLKTVQLNKRLLDDADGEHDVTAPSLSKRQALHSQHVPQFLRCVKATPDSGYIEKRRANRTLAVSKVTKIIEVSPESFSVGRAVLDEIVDGRLTDHLFETVDLVLSMKSPGTINKRAGSMVLYLNWHKQSGSSSPFPITESAVARYLMDMRREETFVSRGASFREALRFFHYALGLDGALAACDSPRVKGAADVMLSGGDDWQPADPFTVEEVLKFHSMLDDCLGFALDRLAAGNVLTMVYGRCRASDLSHVQFAKPDMDEHSGYLEFGTKYHKTSRKAKQKTKLLPIVLPVIGINGKNWVKTLLEIRTQLGLPVGDLNGAPRWPAPASVDDPNAPVWCKRPVSSEEIGHWMQQVVGEGGQGRKITSHSAKATCLSWLAKMGIGREDRDILGRHVNALQGAGPLYSRDIISEPLRKLEGALAKIAGKQFWPDHNRSGFFTPVPNTATDLRGEDCQEDVAERHRVPSTPVHMLQPIKIDDDQVDAISIHSTEGDDYSLEASEKAEESSCESVEGSTDKEDEVLQAVSNRDAVAAGFDILWPGWIYYRHVRSGICHTIKRGRDTGDPFSSFDFGRMLNDKYERIEVPHARMVKCSLCFKAKR